MIKKNFKGKKVCYEKGVKQVFWTCETKSEFSFLYSCSCTREKITVQGVFRECLSMTQKNYLTSFFSVIVSEDYQWSFSEAYVGPLQHLKWISMWH